MKKIMFQFEPKQTETRSVSRLFRFVSWNQNKIFSFCFGVSNLYRNNRNKQNCFETNRNNLEFELLSGVWMWENRSETLKEYTYDIIRRNGEKMRQWRVKSSKRARKEIRQLNWIRRIRASLYKAGQSWYF